MSAVVSPDSVANAPPAIGAETVRRHEWQRAARTVLLAGAAAATLDLAFAFSFYGTTVGASPVRILQSIASGVFGMASFSGGLATAAFGFVAHYFILIVAAGFYYAARQRMPALGRRVAASGLLFGLGIYCVMHFVVLPLSAAPAFRSTPLSETCEFLMHFVLGLAIAAIVWRRAGLRRDLAATPKRERTEAR